MTVVGPFTWSSGKSFVPSVRVCSPILGNERWQNIMIKAYPCQIQLILIPSSRRPVKRVHHDLEIFDSTRWQNLSIKVFWSNLGAQSFLDSSSRRTWQPSALGLGIFDSTSEQGLSVRAHRSGPIRGVLDDWASKSFAVEINSMAKVTDYDSSTTRFGILDVTNVHMGWQTYRGFTSSSRRTGQPYVRADSLNPFATRNLN